MKKKWYNTIEKRHSRRKYLDKPVTDNLIKYMNNFIEKLNRQTQAVRGVLVKDGYERVFKTILGTYGIIQGASSYIAFIGDQSDKNIMEKIGYFGEAVILEATDQGLGTCWVSGTFKKSEVKKQINLDEQEKVYAVTPIGYCNENYSLIEKIMKKVISSHDRKDLDELCLGGFKKNWPDWIKTAIKSARLAPSARNKQPWRFGVKDNKIKIFLDKSTSKQTISERLDCGIAMLHIELGALHKGVEGKWQLLESPEVAIFKAEKQP
ncbi:MAG: nitroreductase family protein [Halothermotrichaceae bacterium]